MQFLKEGLELYGNIESKLGSASCLFVLARLAQSQGDSERAIRLFGAVEALHASIAAPLPPHEQAQYDQARAAARAELGAEVGTARWAEGQAMSLERAIALALEGTTASDRTWRVH